MMAVHDLKVVAIQTDGAIARKTIRGLEGICFTDVFLAKNPLPKRATFIVTINR